MLLSLLFLTLTGLKAYGVEGLGPLANHEISFMTNAFADDDHYRKRHRYRGGSEKNDDDIDNNDRNDYLKPVTNQTYKESCGECHFAYQPELLPSASWLKILNQLDDHFGEEVEADPDMIKTIILTLAIGFVLFELIEHVVFPLFWFIMDRKRKSVCGLSGMLGKVGEVKQWKKNEGKVFVNGELWKAVSDVPLLPGDRVVIQKVVGLTLEVNPWRG